MEKEINRIAVLTSGGDAPGMNAAIRAIVRHATYHDLHIFGIYRGYEGMIEGDIHRLETTEVSNIIHRGGTILKTARSKAFMTPEGRKQAYESLQAHDIDAIITIGGNGTFTGANIFQQEYDIPIVGIPGTIDNDLFGTDLTIGFDTAVNTAIEAVDKIRDTADSHNRLFFIEVMGRHSGFIALNTAIGSGASSVLIPESESDSAVDSLISILKKGAKRKRLFSLVIVAEGDKAGGAIAVADAVQKQFDSFEVKVSIIGHLQRGGSPTAVDRILASRLGFSAVESLLEGRSGVMIGIRDRQIVHVPFQDAIEQVKSPDKELIRMAQILAL